MEANNIKGMVGLLLVIGLIVLGIVKAIKVLKQNNFYDIFVDSIYTCSGIFLN